ncbi:MAG: hypothetical protein CBARDMAM_3791 [uncultured Caballeronia sp.]|nr:MAG: hypothetical protein CBARDMAM_3791 [uncultured Caballeronia sp.]
MAVTQALQDRALVATDDKQFDVTPAGVEWFNSMGLDMAGLKPTPGAVSPGNASTRPSGGGISPGRWASRS